VAACVSGPCDICPASATRNHGFPRRDARLWMARSLLHRNVSHEPVGDTMTSPTKRTISSSVAKAGVGLAAFLTLAVFARPARADLLAAYIQGYGGVSNADSSVSSAASSSSGRQGALGVQAGARILFLELYGDYTTLGDGMAIERAILGLRVGLDVTSKTRIELRLGGGAIGEEGGALTGPANAPPHRVGVVGRAGINLEHQLVDMGRLMGGVGINAETFAMAPADNPTLPQGWISGGDVLASLHLKFELGI
jgi:hypothetical protein